MKKLEPYSEDAEVIGALVLSMLDSMNTKALQPIWEKHEVSRIQPDEWVSYRKTLAILKDVRDQKTGMQSVFDLVDVGIKIADAILDMAYDTLPDFETLFRDNSAMHEKNNRGTSIGYTAIEVSGRTIDIEDHTAWPHDLMYGLYYGYTRHYRSKYPNVRFERVSVEIDSVTGDEYGVYKLTW